jgi:predicted metalloprotease with PDZ domain
VNAGDELLALDGLRIGSSLNTLLRRYEPEATVELALFRDGKLKTLDVTLDPTLADHEITVNQDATPSSRQMRKEWLGGLDEGEDEE